MNLRVAGAADAETIALLHTTSWQDAYGSVLDPAYLAGPVEEERLAYWKSELNVADAGRHALLAEDEENAAGFICVRWPGDPPWGAWVSNLHVARASRGKGAGKQLLKAAAAWVNGLDAQAGMHVWVLEANEPARAFYQHLGGEIVGKGSSQIPAAKGAPILRVWWPRVAHLLNG